MRLTKPYWMSVTATIFMVACIVLYIVWGVQSFGEEPKSKPEPTAESKLSTADYVASLRSKVESLEAQLATVQRSCQTDSVMLNGAINALREFVNRPAPKAEVKPKAPQ